MKKERKKIYRLTKKIIKNVKETTFTKFNCVFNHKKFPFYYGL